MLEKLVTYLESEISATSKVMLALIPLAAIGALSYQLLAHMETNDPVRNTVAILNRAGTGGGTGVILESTPALSKVLTNSHVCKIVEKVGGIVRSKHGDFMVASTQMSTEHDLCLLRVNADLKAHTKIAKKAPVEYYEKATISGHPALLPNVITSGHFSGSKIVPVMVGVRKCTAEMLEKGSEFEKTLCLNLGGLPQTKLYDSVLVTATIMPGSSGSAVYNSDGDLAGLVFATGSEGLGYAWTVPYRAVKHFLEYEVKFTSSDIVLTDTTADAQLVAESGAREYSQFKTKLSQVCWEALTKRNPEYSAVKEFCSTIATDLIWSLGP